MATSRRGSINCSTKPKYVSGYACNLFLTLINRYHSNNVVVVRICARDLGPNTHNHAKEKQVDELALCPFKSLKKPRFTRQFFSFHSSRMDKDIDYQILFCLTVWPQLFSVLGTLAFVTQVECLEILWSRMPAGNHPNNAVLAVSCQ